MRTRWADNHEVHHEVKGNLACISTDWEATGQVALGPAKRTWGLKWTSSSVWLNESRTSNSREVIVAPYSQLITLCLKYHNLFQATQFKRDEKTRVYVTATKMVGGLQHITYEKRLRELALFSLGKRTLRGKAGRSSCNPQPPEGQLHSTAKLSSLVTDDITWAHSHNLQLGRFRVGISRCFFITRSSAASSGVLRSQLHGNSQVRSYDNFFLIF